MICGSGAVGDTSVIVSNLYVSVRLNGNPFTYDQSFTPGQNGVGEVNTTMFAYLNANDQLTVALYQYNQGGYTLTSNQYTMHFDLAQVSM